MHSMTFSSFKIGSLILKNRLVRSATYEGSSDKYGNPTSRYFSLYKTLARNNIGMIITGFSFVSKTGRAMQEAQAGIDSPAKIDFYRKVCDEVHKYDVPFIMQIAHTGRQTLRGTINDIPLSSCQKSSVYFRQKTRLASIHEIEEIIEQFTSSAYWAKEAGFDGVQLHAAHGYLLHQFLLPETNILGNKYGIDKKNGLGTRIIEEIFDSIKDRCGKAFTVLIKISGDHDLSDNFYPDKFDNLIKLLDRKHFDAIEISYGTMDYALNIFRGDLNLELVYKYNPIYMTNNPLRKYAAGLYIKTFISSRFKEFSPAYNLIYAERAKRLTSIPVISVGGFRSKTDIEHAIGNNLTDLVGLSRPFICEPDFAVKLKETSDNYVSHCVNCNKCVFMCDSGKPTVCHNR